MLETKEKVKLTGLVDNEQGILKEFQKAEEDYIPKNGQEIRAAVGGFKPLTKITLSPVNATANHSYSPVLTVAGLITGCGVWQMQGVAYLPKTPNIIEDFKKTLKDAIMKSTQNNRPGAIIATLGSYFKESKKLIEELGFKEVATYKNIAHGMHTSDKQTLYILIIDDNWLKDEQVDNKQG